MVVVVVVVGAGVRRGGGDRRVDMRDCTKTKGNRNGKVWDVVFDLRRITTVTTGSSVFISHASFSLAFFLTAVFLFACMHMSCFLFLCSSIRNKEKEC